MKTPKSCFATFRFLETERGGRHVSLYRKEVVNAKEFEKPCETRFVTFKTILSIIFSTGLRVY
jgi:hypothetical protein